MKYFIFYIVLLSFFSFETLISQPYEKLIDMQASISKRCLNAVLNKEFAKAHSMFTPAMKAEFSADTLALFWNLFEKRSGKFYRVFDTRIDVDPEDTNLVTMIYSIRCAKGNWEIRMSFKGSSDIDGFYIADFKPRYEKKPYTVPEYTNADSVKVRDVIIGKGTDWETTGTLTLPLAIKKYPIIIIIHGSGPLDEDGTYVANKPYADLAWGLASQGIGVLRFPKRTRKFYSIIKDKKIDITPDIESVEDAIAAFNTMKTYIEADSNNIFLLGHGTGGMFLPRALAALPKAKGSILLGAPARPLEDVLYDQLEYVLTLDSIIEKNDADKKLNTLKKQYAAVKSKTLNKQTPAVNLLLETPASYWLSLRNYNQVSALKKINKPVLILHGERDFQASMKDYNLWVNALVGPKNIAGSESKSYPLLNYLFMEGVGKANPAEYAIYDHIPKEVIDDIATWTKKQVVSKQGKP